MTFALGPPLAFSAVSVIDSGAADIAPQLGAVAVAMTVLLANGVGGHDFARHRSTWLKKIKMSIYQRD